MSHKTNSLPEVLSGRICPQDRDFAIGRLHAEHRFWIAVTIGSVEKYITDKAIEQGWSKAGPVEGFVDSGRRVACDCRRRPRRTYRLRRRAGAASNGVSSVVFDRDTPKSAAC